MAKNYGNLYTKSEIANQPKIVGPGIYRLEVTDPMAQQVLVKYILAISKRDAIEKSQRGDSEIWKFAVVDFVEQVLPTQCEQYWRKNSIVAVVKDTLYPKGKRHD